ncbi:MAG TPA: hypothetical protein VKZ82_12975 [Nonomuraea sp.]|nr:hypothetical protein [Nonomuraea sp.]
MIQHTRTEERAFSARAAGASTPSDATRLAVNKLMKTTSAGKFDHEIAETFRVVVTRVGATYQAEASATYARIVPADQPDEATEPEELLGEGEAAEEAAQAWEPF